MSFSWKGLLGVGGAGGNAASGSTSAMTGDSIAGFPGLDEKNMQWDADEIPDVPNMLGMQNFGYTCYVNSVIQALYYCKPFRESLLAYSALVEASAKGQTIGKGIDDTHLHNESNGTGNLQHPSNITPKANDKSLPSNGITDQQHLDEVTFFTALRRLFSNMVTATVTPAPPEIISPPASTSLLASGLSRKNTAKPGASNARGSGSLSTSASIPNTMMLAPSLSLQPPSASATKRIVNSCSHIIVQDDDIKHFISTLKRSNILFDSTAHQDAHELLNFVLNRIGEDVVEEAKHDGRIAKSSRVEVNGGSVSVMDVDEGGRTWVHRVFEGILTNETRCLTCETVTSRDESFLDLSIDIERNSSVTSCLRQFSASEMLCARNKFFCDTCSSLQEAEKRMKVKKLPNVLALHLKRFKYEEALQRFVKLAYRVVFPFEMRLFNTSDDAEEPDKLYELFAIIVHLGTGPHQGHYISIVRVGIRWFVFDDETVTIIDEADIARYFGDTPGAGSAYVLFYQAVELDMERLGLVDAAVERQKAKEKKEEEAWIQYKMGQSPLPETTAIKEVPPRLFSTSPAPMQNSAIPNDIPITPTTPQPAHARQQNTLSSLSSQTTNDLAESKSSSWFSSLRPGSGRKPSTNNHLMGSGQSHGLPIPLKYGTGQGDDVDAASISTSNSSRQAHKEAFEVSPLHKGVPAGDASSPESTIALSNTSYSPSKMVKQPSQGAGAAFAPAGRTLSKKEQEMIAKQSRRASLTASPAVQQLNNGTLTSPNQDTAAVTSSTGQPLWEGRKPLIRRPSTAEPQTIMPRRKTLSSKFSFGLGKKADKS